MATGCLVHGAGPGPPEWPAGPRGQGAVLSPTLWSAPPGVGRSSRLGLVTAQIEETPQPQRRGTSLKLSELRHSTHGDQRDDWVWGPRDRDPKLRVCRACGQARGWGVRVQGKGALGRERQAKPQHPVGPGRARGPRWSRRGHAVGGSVPSCVGAQKGPRAPDGWFF